MDGSFGIDTIDDLLAAANEPDEWLLDGLIEAGDQVVLGGPPKAGKSLLASQLALALASGGRWLGWKAPMARKVLYINLELRKKRFGRRIIAQVGGPSKLGGYSNLITYNKLRTLNILDADQRKFFAKMVKDLGVDLVVWDVLVRVHGAEENDNGAMRKVMHAIRVASADRAHIIVHHTRKPATGLEDVNLGAAGLRGASSIHGEADLILTLHVRAGQGARYSLKFSARNVETPDEMLLDRDPRTLLFHEAGGAEKDRLKEAIQSAFRTGTSCLARNLTEHLMNAFMVKERRAKQLSESAVAQGWITRRRRNDGRYEYCLARPHDLLRSSGMH